MDFSRTEIRDIAVSTVALAFAFGHFNQFFEALFVVGVAFLSHELIGHKFVAQRYNAFAEYMMWPLGLALAVLTSFFGFIFAAPGAVYISPYHKKFAFPLAHLGKREYGIVSLAGPAVNIILGIIFLVGALVYEIGILAFAAHISFFLAFFNLLPIPPLDGSKVIAWNKVYWGAAIAVSFAGYLLV